MHRRTHFVLTVRDGAGPRADGASIEKPLEMALQSTGLDASLSTNRPPFASVIREGEHVPPAFLPSTASQETCRAGRDAHQARPISGNQPRCQHGGCHGNDRIGPSGLGTLPLFFETRKHPVSLSYRICGRKTASHFCWKCSGACRGDLNPCNPATSRHPPELFSCLAARAPANRAFPRPTP